MRRVLTLTGKAVHVIEGNVGWERGYSGDWLPIGKTHCGRYIASIATTYEFDGRGWTTTDRGVDCGKCLGWLRAREEELTACIEGFSE